jgi:hypothetical protein
MESVSVSYVNSIGSVLSVCSSSASTRVASEGWRRLRGRGLAGVLAQFGRLWRAAQLSSRLASCRAEEAAEPLPL